MDEALNFPQIQGSEISLHALSPSNHKTIVNGRHPAPPKKPLFFPWFPSGAGFRPSTVTIAVHNTRLCPVFTCLTSEEILQEQDLVVRGFNRSSISPFLLPKASNKSSPRAIPVERWVAFGKVRRSSSPKVSQTKRRWRAQKIG